MKANPTKTETVKVAIRVRPMNSLEKKNNTVNCVEVDKCNNQISVINQETKEEKTFQFDYVYPPGTTQRQVYDETAYPLVESVFEGYNGTIFAYGQTGCGKTFTMMGDPTKEDLRGIIPNAFAHIFAYINNEGTAKKFLVRCSFIEIYNEEIRDLLGKDSTKKLEVREDPKTGIFVRDLNQMQVKCAAEIENCLNLGNKNRHVGETTMNQESSRSHCIFTVYVEIGENMEDNKNKKIKAGKLNLVDLAGSERQKKTGATGSRLEEAKKINLSLTALSNVINALAEGKSHVPYRDSKLTRLLQDSLGGNTKTVMIAAVSPSSFNFDETLGTLRYAARANSIKNIPKVNEDPKDALLRQYEEQIKKLKEQLELGPSGAPIRYLNDNADGGLPKHIENERQVLNDERLRIENALKEKEQILANSNLEKEKLMQKLQEMEKEMNKKLISGGDEKDEKEKKKFKDYREKQNKLKEEDRQKKELLDQKKKEEDEALQNDVIKLRNKVKFLESEIRDLRYENERDREDIVDTVKALSKESKLYQGLVKMILSDQEIKRIVEMCKWNEDNEEWKIQPFSFREKKLQLPNIKPYQVPDFVENEINSRELIVEEYLKNTVRTNKFNNNMRETNQNFAKNMNRNNRYDETTSDLFNIKNPQNQKNSSSNTNSNVPKNVQLDPLNTINKKQNPNLIVINKKEAKKYEDLLKTSNFNNYDISANSPPQPHSVAKMKAGKVILDPINNNQFNQSKKQFYSNNQGNNKKMELSFKATLQFTDDNGVNKFEFNPNINYHQPNITNLNVNNYGKKVRLEKIPESKLNSELEFDDQY